jgi:hypothetical protein
MSNKLEKLISQLTSMGYLTTESVQENLYQTGETACLSVRGCLICTGPKLEMFDMPDDVPDDVLELVRSSYTDLGNLIVGNLDRHDLELLIDDLREIEYHAYPDDEKQEYVKISDKLFDAKDVGLLYTSMYMLDNDNSDYVSVVEIISNSKVYYGFELRNDLSFIMPALFNEDIHELKLF